MSEIKDTVLTTFQQRRVEALMAGRALLVQTSLFGANPARSVDDLIKLSTWILGPEQARADNPLTSVMQGYDLKVVEIPLGDQANQTTIDEAKQKVVDLLGEDGVPDEARRAAVKMLRNSSCKKSDCRYDCADARELADSIEAQITAEDPGTPQEPMDVDPDAEDTTVIPTQDQDLFPGPEQVDEAEGNYTDPIPVGNWQDAGATDSGFKN